MRAGPVVRPRLSLVDSTGAATTATATWAASNIVGDCRLRISAGNTRMMKGYLDDGDGSTTTVSVTGLPASASGYQVYVYADGADSGACTSIYTISGDGDHDDGDQSDRCSQHQL